MNEEIHSRPVETRAAAPSLLKRISWGAIFAGLIIALVTQLMLTLLGMAIGAATVDPLQEQDPLRGLGIGSAIWLAITSLISTFAGACVAGRLSGGPRETDGVLHGLVTWGSATLLTVFLLTTAVGTLFSGAAGVLGRTVSGAARAAGASGEGMREQMTAMMPQLETMLPPTGRTNLQAGTNLLAQAKQDPEVRSALAGIIKKGGLNAAPEERRKIVQALSLQGMSEEQANQALNQWEQEFQHTKQQVEVKARQTGDAAAKGVAKTAMWGFIAMLLGAAAAAFGGYVGVAPLARRRTDVTVAAT